MRGLSLLLWLTILLDSRKGLVWATTQRLCEAGNRTYDSPDPVLLLLPRAVSPADRECTCQIRSPHPARLTLLLAPLPSSGGGEHIGISLRGGNASEDLQLSSLHDDQCLARMGGTWENGSSSVAGDCRANFTANNLTLITKETKAFGDVLVFYLHADKSGTKDWSVSITCQANAISTAPITTASKIHPTDSSKPQDFTSPLFQEFKVWFQEEKTNHSRMTFTNMAVLMVVAVILLLVLVLIALLVYRRRDLGSQGKKQGRQAERKSDRERLSQRRRRQPESGEEYEDVEEVSTALGHSITEPEPHRQRSAIAHSQLSLASNLSSDVFHMDGGTGGPSSPPPNQHGGPAEGKRGRRHKSGGADRPQPPVSGPPHSDRRGSTPTTIEAGGGKSGFAETKDQRPLAPPPSACLHSHPALPPTPIPTPSTPSPLEEEEEDGDSEWYGNFEVEKMVKNEKTADDNIYEDPDSTKEMVPHSGLEKNSRSDLANCEDKRSREQEEEEEYSLLRRSATHGQKGDGVEHKESEAANGCPPALTCQQSVKVISLKTRPAQQQVDYLNKGKKSPENFKVSESPLSARSPSPGQEDKSLVQRAGQQMSISPSPLSSSEGQNSRPQSRSPARGPNDIRPSPRHKHKSRSPTPTRNKPSPGRERQTSKSTPTHSRDPSPAGLSTPDKRKSQDSLGPCNTSVDPRESNHTMGRHFEEGSWESLDETLEIPEEAEEDIYQNSSTAWGGTKEAGATEVSGTAELTRPSQRSPETTVMIENELYESSSAGNIKPFEVNAEEMAVRNQPFTYLALPNNAQDLTGVFSPVASKSEGDKAQVQQAEDVGKPDECEMIDNILYESSTDFCHSATSAYGSG